MSDSVRWLISRYALAVGAVAAAMGLRLALTAWVGPGLPTYITFYPAVMTVALLGGAGPGLAATALTGLVVAYWILPPVGQWTIASPVDRLGLVIFGGMGLFMSVIAEFYRRYRLKAAAYDREAAVRESQARLAAFAEATFEGIVENEAGRIVDCNEQFARMMGYSVAELKGVEITRLIAPEAHDRVMANIRQCRESLLEHVMFRKDGARIIVEVHGRPVSPGSTRRLTAIRDITARTQTEKVLQRYELLARYTRDVVLFLRSDNGQILEANTAAEEAYGYTRKELLAMTVSDLYVPGERISAAVQLAEADPEGTLFETVHLRKDGSSFPVEVSSRGADIGSLHTLISVVRDITERKRAEAALRESEERFRSTFDHGAVAMALTALDGKLMKVNRAFRQMLGYSESEMLGRSFAELTYPDDLGENLAGVGRVARGEVLSFRMEKRYFHKNGSIIWTDLSTAFVPDSHGKPLYLVTHIQDITERKRAEVALRTTLQRFYKILSSMYSAVLLLTDEGQVEFANQAICNSFGLTETPEDLAGLNAPAMIEKIKGAYLHPDEAVARIREVVDRGEPVRGEEVALTGGRTCLRDYVPLNIDGKSNGRLWLHFDITGRKQMEESLRESEERYRLLFQSLQEGFYLAEAIFDNGGKCCDALYLDVNPAFEEIMGRSRDQIVGKRVRELVPDIKPEWLEVFGTVTQTGEAVSHQTYSEIFQRHFEAFVFRPVPGRFGVLVTDISERKRAEVALRQSEERYRALFNTLIEGFCIIEVVLNDHARPVDYRFLEVNPAFEKQTGLHDVQGKLMRDLAPDHEAHWFEVYGQVALTGEPVRFVSEARALNRWFDVSAYRLGGSESRKVAILFNDITESKRQEDELRELSQRLTYHVDHSPLAVIEFGPDMRLTRWSGEAERIFGWQAEEVLGRRMDDFRWIFEEDELQVEEVTAELQTGTNPHRFSANRNYRNDGSVVHCEWYNSSLLDDSGELRSILSLVLDVTERRRVEDALRKSERRERERAEELAALFEAVPVAVFIARDPDCLHLTGNRLADEILRIPHGNELSLSGPADARPHHFKPIKDGRELRLEELPAQRSARGEHVNDFEFTLAFDDGVIRHVLGYGTPLLDDQGHPRGTVAVLVDITERKRAEEALQENEARLRLAQEGASVGIWDWKVQTGSLDFTPELNKLYGLPSGTIRTYQDWRDRVHPEDIGRVEAGRDEAIAKHEPFDLEFRGRHSSGEYRWISTKGGAFYQETGEVIRVLGVNIDITDRKRTEKRLWESEQQLRTLADSIPNLAWRANGDGYVTWYNYRWYEYTGTTPEQMEGWGWQSVHDPDELPHVLARWTASLATGEPFNMIFPLRGADDIFRPFLTRVMPLKDEQGRVQQWFGTNTDISEQKRTELELRRLRAELELRVEERTAELTASNRELEAFSYTVSHDLRAPLRHITSFVALLEGAAGPALNDLCRHYMKNISEAAQRMGHLIDDLLMFSRIGRAIIADRPVSLRRLVDEARAELASEADDRAIDWQIGPLPEVRGDPTLLRSVMINLLSNAIKYTRRRELARIEVGCREEAGEVVCFVRDNGAGFDMKFVDKLFGVFQRLHRAEEFGGTGIGLASVRRVIHRHGGRTWAEAELDRGATFFFSLPSRRDDS